MASRGTSEAVHDQRLTRRHAFRRWRSLDVRPLPHPVFPTALPAPADCFHDRRRPPFDPMLVLVRSAPAKARSPVERFARVIPPGAGVSALHAVGPSISPSLGPSPDDRHRPGSTAAVPPRTTCARFAPDRHRTGRWLRPWMTPSMHHSAARSTASRRCVAPMDFLLRATSSRQTVRNGPAWRRRRGRRPDLTAESHGRPPASDAHPAV